MSKFWAAAGSDDSSSSSSSSDDSSSSSDSSAPAKGGGDNRWVMDSDSGKKCCFWFVTHSYGERIVCFGTIDVLRVALAYTIIVGCKERGRRERERRI